MVGTVTIGAKDGNAVEEARRRIALILDPPTAEVGAIYQGQVVNITKFGAFVNILPGRDGLLHISKLSPLAGGKRVDQVEDVLTLGQAIEVRVDDIDPQGKVSLSSGQRPRGRGRRSAATTASGRPDNGGAPRPNGPTAAAVVSFEDAFEAELTAELGDLGPAAPAGGGGEGRGDGGDRRRSRNRPPRRR